MIYFIALIIFLLPSYLVRFSIFNIPTTLLEVLIYIAFVVTIIQNSKVKSQNENPKVKNLKPIIHDSLFMIPIILFIISGIISVIIAPDKREALGLFKGYIIDPILFFWIILAEFSKEKKFEILNPKSETNLNFQNSKIGDSLKITNFKLKILIKSLILSGVVVAIHAIWQKVTGHTTIDGRVLGIFGFDPSASPNYLAFYLAPITVLEISYWLLIINRKNFITQLLNCLITLLLFFALWFTGSRAAIGAVIVGVMSYLVISYWQQIKSNKIIVTLLYCFIVLMITIGWQITKPDWNASPDSGRISSSNNIRWEIWKTTAKDIIPHNLIWLKGVGLGNYQNYFTDLTKDRVNYPEWISPLAVTPHNIFLNVWVNLGLLGLISFVWLLILFFKLSIINYQLSIKNNFITGYWLLVTAMMIAILIQGLVDSTVWKNDLVVMFWLILALSQLADKIRSESNSSN